MIEKGPCGPFSLVECNFQDSEIAFSIFFSEVCREGGSCVLFARHLGCCDGSLKVAVVDVGVVAKVVLREEFPRCLVAVVFGHFGLLCP